MVRPPFLFPAPAEASSLLNVTSGPGVAEAEAGRGPGYVTGVCLVIYAAAAASLGNVVQVVLRTVLYYTVLYCTVVQVVLLRTHPEITNNLLMISLGKHLTSAEANTGILITCKLLSF